MEYFILMDGEDPKNVSYSSNLLGESSFGVFYAEDGLKSLMQISKEYPDKLLNVKIIDSKGATYSIEDFLNILERHQIRIN